MLLYQEFLGLAQGGSRETQRKGGRNGGSLWEDLAQAPPAQVSPKELLQPAWTEDILAGVRDGSRPFLAWEGPQPAGARPPGSKSQPCCADPVTLGILPDLNFLPYKQEIIVTPMGAANNRPHGAPRRASVSYLQPQ
jgi:hypothetical protein